MRVVLLGPQRRPTVDSVVRSLDLPGPFATVTAGWREREPDDGELTSLLGGPAGSLSGSAGQERVVNLGLYRRGLDVAERDPVFAAGWDELRRTVAELQEVYLLRLDYALRAVYAVQRRAGAAAGVAAGAAAGAVEEAVAAVRELDEAHLRRVNGARGEFYARLEPHARPVIAAHRDEVAAVLRESRALVVAGGHVGVLADALHLFNVAAAVQAWPGAGPVIAWSAGAMALADRIVLFHDRAPQGPGHPEVYGSGLSLVRDVVLLPHARARLRLDDAARMSVFARRFAPGRLVPLEAGNRIDVVDGAWPSGVRVIEAA